MPPEQLQKYLYDKIPLASAMQVCAMEATQQTVRLSAPLIPNLNHRATIFGGSASAVAILSAWALLHVKLHTHTPGVSIVIQRHHMEYGRPMLGTFEASARLAQPQEWPRFLKMLDRWGKARVGVHCVLEYAGEQAGQFSGEFVAFADA